MNQSTLLLRQIHPNFIEDTQVSSQAFYPFPKDDFLLSVYDGQLISAELAYLHYTQTLGFESSSVYAIAVNEVSQIGLSCRPDPLDDFPEHAVVDFTHDPKNARKLAKKLRSYAVARGCLYP